jgi:uncharacterized protein (TIGR02265 family)
MVETKTPVARQHMFEGLYDKVLRPEGGFRERLKAAGYDIGAPLAAYPMQVWVDCLDVTWKEKFPHLERFAAWQAIGRLFIEGYLETLVGRLVAVALPFLTPRGFLQRAPRFMNAGLEGATAEVVFREEREAVVTLRGPHAGAAWVLSGVIAVCLERLGVTPSVTPGPLEGIDSQVLVSWTK